MFPFENSQPPLTGRFCFCTAGLHVPLLSNSTQIFQILRNGPTDCCSYHSSHKHTTIIRTGQTSQPLSSPLGNPHRPAWNGWVIYDNGFRCSEHMAYTTRENALDMLPALFFQTQDVTRQIGTMEIPKAFSLPPPYVWMTNDSYLTS